jgi:hypothetical protein
VHHYMPGATHLWLLLGLTCFEMNDLAIYGPSRNQRKGGPEIASAGIVELSGKPSLAGSCLNSAVLSKLIIKELHLFAGFCRAT